MATDGGVGDGDRGSCKGVEAATIGNGGGGGEATHAPPLFPGWVILMTHRGSFTPAHLAVLSSELMSINETDSVSPLSRYGTSGMS